MGEIKSTLDLVLEKTKNLKLSSEEKEEQKQQEIEKRIKGMLQKYQDGVSTKQQFNADYKNLQRDFALPNDKQLIDEILSRLDPDNDNQILLEILTEFCKVNSATIEAMINDYQVAYHQAEADSSDRLKEYLTTKYSISGSAVVPNLETDEQWRQKAQALRSGFRDRLSREKDRLLGEK